MVKLLTQNKVNILLICILLIFFFIASIPFLLQHSIPPYLEDKVFNTKLDNQKDVDLLDKIGSDKVITWKEYLEFIWR
jgi:hypothetical protein